jgi:hypothetical protein
MGLKMAIVTVVVDEAPTKEATYPYTISLNVTFPDTIIYKQEEYFYVDKGGVDLKTKSIPSACYKNAKGNYIWVNIYGEVKED